MKYDNLIIAYSKGAHTLVDAAKKIGTTTEIDLLENAVYMVKEGKLVQAPAPETGHGTVTIHWQGGKPCHGKIEQNFKL